MWLDFMRVSVNEDAKKKSIALLLTAPHLLIDLAKQ